MTTANLKYLHPDLYHKAMEFLDEVVDRKIHCRIISTFRSAEEQAYNYSIGRRGKKGEKIVTYAKPGYSHHNATDDNGNPAARAFDIALFRNGRYISDGSDPLYLEVGEIGESLGLKWGGRWRRPDPSHFELPDVEQTVA